MADGRQRLTIVLVGNEKKYPEIDTAGAWRYHATSWNDEELVWMIRERLLLFER